MRSQGLKSVLAAGGGEPAHRGQQGADEPAVADYGNDKEPCRQRRHGFVCRAHLRCAHWRSAPTCRRSSRPSTRSRSAARSAWRAPAAAGCARNTSKQPPGSEATRPRISSRSRRFTRLRTTAEPTARLTTKPTFGSAYSGTGPAASSRCPDRVTPPARRPERIARLNSSGLLIRDCCGSTTPPAQADMADNPTRPAPPAAKPHRGAGGSSLRGISRVRNTGKVIEDHQPRSAPGPQSASRPAIRRRADRGPCDGVRQGRRGQHGYASAHGNRAPSPAGGCSAGTCAYSLGLQVVRGTVLNQGQTCRAPRAPNMAQPVNGTGDRRTGQTKPLPG